MPPLQHNLGLCIRVDTASSFAKPFCQSKDPSPEGPALAHPRGVMKMATFTSSA